VLACGTVGTLLFFAIVGRPLLFASLDEPMARASGVPARALAVGFLLVLGLGVAATAQITGVLLVFGHEAQVAGSNVVLGAALVFGSAVASACYLVFSGEEVRRLREAHGLRRDYVLWCGTLEPRKNVPVLLAAFRRLVDRRVRGNLLLDL